MSKLYKFVIVGILVIVSVIGLSTKMKIGGVQKPEQPNIASESQTKKTFAEEEPELEGTKVIAYYFHTTSRCHSCYTIEKYTKEALESNFEDELVSGKLVFKPVNMEVKENEHFLGDYQLYTKSVVLSLIEDSKEVKFKAGLGVAEK